MIRFELGSGLLVLALSIYCLLEVIMSDEGEIRNLPKVTWLLIVLFFPLVGSVAWLVAGRPTSTRRRPASWEREVPQFPEYDRPGRAAGATAESDEEFLRKVRERAEEQRRAYREEQRRRQQEQGEA